MAVHDTPLSREAQDRYLTYALSVVSGRALPDVRDGLKPVQRRILFTMINQLNLRPNGNHRKSAAVVGEVLGKFHPHGDVACYEAMVRMAQDFSLRYPLVDGQGNFGSLDGDGAAAYRYTEARLREIAIDVIGEIDEETVDFRDNFDGTLIEPVVLPSRVPNLLINGAMGIAVGMATSIPPHNLKETIKALTELLDDPEISPAKLAGSIKGPDFPTGCLILNTTKELSEMYKTGRGSVRMRGEWNLEEGSRGKRYIIITSIPYTVNKAQLVEKIASLIVDKKIPQLNDIRDESTDDVRIVLELAGDSDPETAMVYLFKHTPLETNFPVNLTALAPGKDGVCRPQTLSLKECLQHFLDFREQVVIKRLTFEKRKLLERIHILEGLVKIYDALDVALKIVRSSEGRSDAAQKLMARFKLTEIQSFAVVDMRIYQLSRTNISEIREELEEKEARVKEIDGILKNRKKLIEVVRRELEEVGEKFGDKRKCKLIKESVEEEYDESLYVVEEDVFAIVTNDGWLKRIRQNNELSSTRLREGDSILSASALSTKDHVVFFTNLGSLYVIKVSDFPSSSGYGDPIQKFLKFKDGEKVIATFPMRSGARGPAYVREGSEMFFLSGSGLGFRGKLEGIEGTKRSGKRFMKVRDDDEVVVVAPALEGEVVLAARSGSGLRIKSDEIPEREGASLGVSLLSVREGDAAVAMVPIDEPCDLEIELSNGSKKVIPSKEIVSGRRALKGNKIVSRGEVLSIRKATKEDGPKKGEVIH